MTAISPALLVRLHRIEVHATPPQDDDFPEIDWRVWATGTPSDAIVLSGYIAARSVDGYGQAQVVAIVSDRAAAAAESVEAAAEFIDWAKRHVTGIMYDTARRSLQSQAAQMDFIFAVPDKAPEVDLQLRNIDDLVDDDAED